MHARYMGYKKYLGWLEPPSTYLLGGGLLKGGKAEMDEINKEFWRLIHEENLSPAEAAKKLREKYPLKKRKLPDDWIPDGGG
jgi:hypothetical protein